MNDSPSPSLAAPWGVHSVPADGTGRVELGPLTLWTRRRAGEIWLAHAPGDWSRSAGTARREPPPEGEGWVRWPVPAGMDRLRLWPLFPPRTLVVKPDLSFRLLPRSSARIYVRVPLWVRVDATAGDAGDDGGSGRPTTLTEVPSVTLSDTWWGEFTDGELCYWLPTSARRQVDPESFAPHQVVCPLELSNRSERELEVEKVALRVEHLSVFAGERGFWSDVTRVRYRGESEGSDIDVSGFPPEEARGGTRVAGPRTPLDRSFRARTFSRLRSLSGLGGM